MLYNQVTLTQTGVAKQLGVGTINGSVYIKAYSSNVASVYVGDSAVTSGNGFELGAGEILPLIDVGSIAGVYIVGTANDKVCYIESEF